MHITVKHFEGQYPSFNIMLHSAVGSEPFLEIKGCRIVNGSNGPFISYPSRKDEKTGKFWNHVYGGEAFNAHVLKIAGGAPKPAPKPAPVGSGFDDMSDDIPFRDPMAYRGAHLVL